MEIKQLIGSEYDTQQSMLSAKQADMWTAIPGIIKKYDPLDMTCDVLPAIQARMFGDQVKDFNLPLLLDCPVQFPGAGSTSITFPVQIEDECLVVFSSRCIDSWWSTGSVGPQMEMRMHDLSDGFVLLGFKSQPNVVPDLNLDEIQIRNNTGSVRISLNPVTEMVTITTPTDITMNAANININANLNIVGDTTHTGSVNANGKVIDDTHTHTGVTSGSGSTGVVS